MSTTFTKLEDPAALVPDRELRDCRPCLPEPMSSLMGQAEPSVLTGDQLLAAEAMRLLIRLDRNLLDAGSMESGLVSAHHAHSPQGGPTPAKALGEGW